MSNVEQASMSTLSPTQRYSLSLMSVPELKIYSQEIRHKCHITREKLFNMVRRYYNQGVSSNFIKENDIIALATQAKSEKELYDAIQRLLLSRKNEINSEER
jgi:hypothetical protein